MLGISVIEIAPPQNNKLLQQALSMPNGCGYQTMLSNPALKRCSPHNQNKDSNTYKNAVRRARVLTLSPPGRSSNAIAPHLRPCASCGLAQMRPGRCLCSNLSPPSSSHSPLRPHHRSSIEPKYPTPPRQGGGSQ